MTSAPFDNAADAAQAVNAAWAGFPGKSTHGYYAFSSGSLTLAITDIRASDENGTLWVEVWTGGYFPAVQFSNPDLLILDNEGDVEIQVVDGRGELVIQKYRFAPVESIAEAIIRMRGGR